MARTGGSRRNVSRTGTRTSRTAVAAALAVLLALAGCGSRGRGDSPAGRWSEADLRYGAAPADDLGVTLQPDVVIVRGGGNAIRSVSADGLTWRIDAHAPGAGDLAPGKVMFVTERAVGRVLDLAPDGDDLLVTIGPVDLVEVIRDGTLAGSDVTLEDPIVYAAGDPFWAEEPSASSGTSQSVGLVSGRYGSAGRASSASGAVSAGGAVSAQAAGAPQPEPQRGGTATSRVRGYSVYTTCCVPGVGARFSYDDGGVRLVGTVTLTTSRPTASFHVAIGGGTVTRAELEIGGGFGIKVDFEAAISDGVNHAKEFQIPADVSFPIGQLAGIPISFTVSQTLTVQTAFGAKLGSIKGSGEFTLAGALGFGYVNGQVGPRVTQNFSRVSSLINSLTGVPVGVMGLVIRHGVRFTVGIGALLFKAGVYFGLSTSYGATLGSALGAPLAQCRGVALGVHARYGVGYTILEPVVTVINKFLSLLRPIRALNIKPINPSGGISWTAPIYTAEEVIPDVQLCGHAPK
jgi:hypothetical protein